jgi:hypothetical protein
MRPSDNMRNILEYVVLEDLIRMDNNYLQLVLEELFCFLITVTIQFDKIEAILVVLGHTLEWPLHSLIDYDNRMMTR